MKRPSSYLLAIVLGGLLAAMGNAAPGEGPRFKAQVACFNGAPDVASSCTGVCFQPDGTLQTAGKMTCGFPGKVSTVTWSFVKQRGGQDVYQFTRRFPIDAANTLTSTQEVEFSDRRVVIFQDEHQTILMEPPRSQPRTTASP